MAKEDTSFEFGANADRTATRARIGALKAATKKLASKGGKSGGLSRSAYRAARAGGKSGAAS